VNIDKALQWAATRQHGVLITIRADGRAQSSDIMYALDAGQFTISVTETRAKTANMRRDNRVVLHLTDPAAWSYVSFDGTVELGPTTTSPTDPASDALVEHYSAVAGKPHPDWAAYRQAMVQERRLLATFTPTSAVGQISRG
jgi:PPOX class probable F420-dependent enzyme